MSGAIDFSNYRQDPRSPYIYYSDQLTPEDIDKALPGFTYFMLVGPKFQPTWHITMFRIESHYDKRTGKNHRTWMALKSINLDYAPFEYINTEKYDLSELLKLKEAQSHE